MIEVLEQELGGQRERFVMLEQEVTEAQDTRNEAERERAAADRLKVRQEAEIEALNTRLEEQGRDLEEGQEARLEVARARGEAQQLQAGLEAAKRLQVEAEARLAVAETALQEVDRLEGAEERWREAELVVAKLEGQCREEEARGREEAERRGREVGSLEGEVRGLTEQLEESESKVQDKNSQVAHLEQRLGEGEAALQAMEEQVVLLREEVARGREESEGREGLESLAARVEALTGEMARKSEEVQEVGVARNLLLEQVQEQQEENCRLAGSLQEAAGRLEVLQEQLREVREERSAGEARMRQSGEGAALQLASLSAMVTDVSTENESLQEELRAAQADAAAARAQICVLQAEMAAEVGGGGVQHPPPDITHNSRQPDLVGGRGSREQPDIMGGREQPLDLVREQGWEPREQAGGGGWFDDFEPVPPQQYNMPDVEQVKLLTCGASAVQLLKLMKTVNCS